MHGDEQELEAAGEEAEHQQHVRAVPEGFGQRIAQRLLAARRAGRRSRIAGVRNAAASGMMLSVMSPKPTSACCQPNHR